MGRPEDKSVADAAKEPAAAPAETADQPPVDNDHVAEGAERFEEKTSDEEAPEQDDSAKVVQPTSPPNPPDPIPAPPGAAAVAPIPMTDEEKAAIDAAAQTGAAQSAPREVDIGDTVIVRQGRVGEAVFSPAMVTNVFGDAKINATVMADLQTPFPLSQVSQSGTPGDELTAWFFRK